MARRRTKSSLDRLVEANRGRNKGNRRGKIQKQYLPPEQMGLGSGGTAAATAEYPDEDVEYQPVAEPDTTPAPQPRTEQPESDAEDLLDELVQESVVEAKDEGTPVASAKSLAAAKDPVAERQKFHRPAHAPIRPSVPQSTLADRVGRGQIIIDLSEPIYRELLSQKKDGQLLRELIAARLTACLHHTSEKPLYLNDSMRRKVEQFAHRDFSSPEEFIGWLLSSLDIFIGAEGLNVEPYLIQRALDRKPPEQTFGEYLSELLTFGIEVKTGMR